MKRSGRNYTKEKKQKALDYYHDCKSVTKTIRDLGYPSRSCMILWIEEERKPLKIPRKPDHSMGRATYCERTKKITEIPLW